MSNNISRRRMLRGTALAVAGAGTAFFGPWRHNRIYASATDKPIRIGLTHDASGQFANSGQAEKRGTILAIEEARACLPLRRRALSHANGGVLGRQVEHVWMDTETTPQTGTRVAERTEGSLAARSSMSGWIPRRLRRPARASPSA